MVKLLSSQPRSSHFLPVIVWVKHSGKTPLSYVSVSLGAAQQKLGINCLKGINAEANHLLVEEFMSAGITLQMQCLAFGLAAAE